jgi:hypothetical protein
VIALVGFETASKQVEAVFVSQFENDHERK